MPSLDRLAQALVNVGAWAEGKRRSGMIDEMANVAKESLRYPRRVSVWVPELNRYVCPESEEGRRALAGVGRPATTSHLRVPNQTRIDPQFKLVFLSAAAGTLLFVVVCVTLTLLSGKDMPAPLERLVTGLFDLAKIGFGAVVGLLGGKVLQADAEPTPRTKPV